MVALTALGLTLAGAPSAFAAQVGKSTGPALFFAGPNENNLLTVSVNCANGNSAPTCDLGAGSNVTFTDTGTVTPGGGPVSVTNDGTCTQLTPNSVRCDGPFTTDPSDTSFFRAILALLEDGDDTFLGSRAAEGIGGGTGFNFYDAGLGNDNIQGGSVTGTAGSDTASYAGRSGPVVLLPPASPTSILGGERLADKTTVVDNDFMTFVENFIGGSGDDLIVGTQYPNILNGGPAGADILCGNSSSVGSGDTVDYSTNGLGAPRTAPVSVSLDGHPDLPTDPLLEGSDPTARNTCQGRASIPSEAGKFDCMPNDGAASEGDCVGEDVENIIGGSGNDTLIGNSRAKDCPTNPPQDTDPVCDGPRFEPLGLNVLDGGPGNDTLNGLTEEDTFIGGDGFDTVTYADRADPVVGSIDGAANDGGLADYNNITERHDDIGEDVESVIGGEGADTLRGDADANSLIGNGGNDLIEGNAGADDVSAGAGDDTVRGGAGSDDLLGDGGNDSLDGGEGSDNLDGGADNDNLYGGLGPDLMVGSDGSDVADYHDYTTRVSVVPDGVANDGSPGELDNVSDTMEGATGGGDDDSLFGNGGAGVLSGGDGDDWLDGGGGPDTLIGGPGADTASYGSAGGPVGVTIGSGADDGQPGEGDDVQGDVEKVSGTEFADTLTAGAGGAILGGRGGNDDLNGGAGVDLLLGGDGNDSLDGGDGRDELSGEAGNDNLRGGPQNDTLHGGPGNDSLDGGAHSDILNGHRGTDTAMYNTRRNNVNVDVNGVPDDGERGEGDIVRTDVESTRTGSGDDWINTRDGKAGEVTCGAGTDNVKSDSSDKVGSDCEVVNRSSSRCRVAQRSVRMKRSGTLSVRVRCAIAGAATLRLRSKSTLASKRFTARSRSKARTVKVKLSRKARRTILRRKRMRVRAIVTIRPRGVAGQSRQKAKRSTRALTIRAPRGR